MWSKSKIYLLKHLHLVKSLVSRWWLSVDLIWPSTGKLLKIMKWFYNHEVKYLQEINSIFIPKDFLGWKCLVFQILIWSKSVVAIISFLYKMPPPTRKHRLIFCMWYFCLYFTTQGPALPVPLKIEVAFLKFMKC